MTELTINDLNCYTCPDGFPCGITGIKSSSIKKSIALCGMVGRCGCMYHPFALQVLAKPVIEELERCKREESILPEDTPQYCFDMAIKYAIKLLKGETK